VSRLRRLLTLPLRHPWVSLGLVLLGVSLTLGAVQGAGYLRYRRHRQAAEEAIARYDFEPAYRHLTECLRWRPNDPALLLLAARTARRAELPKEADELLSRLRRQAGGTTPEGALERALLQAQGGQLHLVEEDLLARVEADDPDTELILEALALGAAKVYRTDKAMIRLQRLLQEEPDNVPGRLLRGMLYESLGNMKAALEDYHKVVESHPDNGRARLRLAEALLKHQRYPDAATHFERLLQDGPRRPAALLGLAQCRLQQFRDKDARQLLDELLAEAPDDGTALRERGKLALVDAELAKADRRLRPQKQSAKTGTETDAELTKAERLLRRAVAVQPYDREAAFQLSVCLSRLGKAEEADKYQKRVKQMEADLKRFEVLYPQTIRKPDAVAPRLEIAQICMRNGRDDEARRWFNSVLQLDARNRAAHRALAEIYRRRNDKDRAHEHLRLAGDLPSGS
jgi:tetratricopeptide (TPR) repeat protein